MKYRIVPVTPFQQNCTLLICGHTQKAAVVDPGGDVNLILDAMDRENAELEKIFVTHGHADHIGAVFEIAGMFGIPVEGPHRDDLFWIEALPSQCLNFGLPHSEAFTPSRWLEQGDRVAFGEQRLEVLHCPGHTPGHVVFYHARERLALVGDVLFKGSIGRTDFPRGDFDTLIDSIRHKLWPLGDDVAFVPGHGPMSTFGDEMKYNPFVHD
ncbi:MAG: MBL fold metallo-hydrolase [Gammaproteobacteria bacterium]